MTQSTQSLGFDISKRKYGNSLRPMRFNLAPNAFARIQLWTIRGQQMQTQLSLPTLNFLSYFTGLVHGMAIPGQKIWPRGSRHRTEQKLTDHFLIQSPSFDPKPHSPAQTQFNLYRVPVLFMTKHFKGLKRCLYNVSGA